MKTRNLRTARITRRPLAWSAPSKPFAKIWNLVTALIDVMPPSGTVPLNPFVCVENVLTARIAWRPLAGSAPSRWFSWTSRFVTALIDVMPPSGSVPLKPF
eukprot:2780065-Amphidinium_carterae.1